MLGRPKLNRATRLKLKRGSRPKLNRSTRQILGARSDASAFAEQALRSYPMPSIPEMAEVWVPMDSSLQLCLVGKQDVKSALDDAVKLINQQIEAFRSQM